MKYLITGTGRCGTGYAAKVLLSAGIRCGHEAIFGTGGLEYARQVVDRIDADSSWLAAPFVGTDVLDGVHIIHLVRHPKHVIESLLRIRFFDDSFEPHQAYRDFAYEHLPGLREIEDETLKCAFFYVNWNLMIEERCAAVRHLHTRVQAEDRAARLIEPFGIQGDGLELFGNRRYNSRGIRRASVDLAALGDSDIKHDLASLAIRYGYDLDSPPKVQPRLFWGVMMERSIPYGPVNHLLDIAMHAGAIGAMRISIPYQRPDAARNMMVESFRAVATSPDDVLIMLDCDHKHPENVLEKLAGADLGVIGALAFRRSAPYEPMFFVRNKDGGIRSPAILDPVIYEGDAVGTAAIAIKRWVFDKLEEAGAPYFFRYEYQEKAWGWRSSEDAHFAKLCEDAGIRHHVDASLVTPHMGILTIDEGTWEEYRENHPEIVFEEKEEAEEKETQEA